MRKPTPQEIEQLRAAYPLGAPRIDYREMSLRIASEGYPPTTGKTGKATNPVDDDQDELEEDMDGAGDDDAESEEEDEAAEKKAKKAAAKAAAARKAAARAIDPTQPIGLSFSSEQAVLRYDWWSDERYYEVLDHAPGSVDLSYSRDGLPFVASHRAWDADSQHGIVENVRIAKDRTLRGDILMSDAPQSLQIGRDMLRGIRKKVSVGYILGDDYEQTKGGADGIPVRRYKSWMPIEVSTVPIPADYSVGIGRAQSADGQAALARFLELHTSGTSSTRSITPVTPTAGSSTQQGREAERSVMSDKPTPAAAQPSQEAAAAIIQVRETNRLAEIDRVEKIVQLGSAHGVNDRVPKWLEDGTTVSDVLVEVNRVLESRLAKPTVQARPINLPAKDHARFSYAKTMLMQDGKLEREFTLDREFGGRKLDYGLEREILDEARRRNPVPAGAEKGGLFVPYVTLDDGRDLSMGERLKELQERETYLIRANIDSATTSTGGPFKFTQPGDFITLLRNKTSVLRAGVTVLSGLTGPVTFPKQNAAATGTWVAENPGSDMSRSNLTNTTVTLSFKTIQSATAVSRQALFSAASGNYDLEAIIRGDLAAVIGLAIDLAGLNGLGSSNQPLGLLQDTNVGTAPALGAQGGTMAWGNIIDLETAIGDANGDIGTMSYLTNTKQRGVVKKVAVLGNTASGVPIWTGTPGIMDGQVNGYRAIASNQVPRNLTKGTQTTICSAWVFGVFEHLLMGVFGSGFEVLTDPYTLKLQNMVDITAWSFVDFANRYPVAFSTIKDAL